MEKKFKELFIEELNDMFSTENQLVRALPDLMEAAESPELKEAFREHLEETKNQVNRLNKIFSLLNVTPPNTNSKSMQALITECSEIISQCLVPGVRDAALIAKAQRLEHYEIAAYGVLRTFADLLDMNEVEDLLEASENEEGNADKNLTKIAKGGWFTAGINQKASTE